YLPIDSWRLWPPPPRRGNCHRSPVPYTSTARNQPSTWRRLPPLPAPYRCPGTALALLLLPNRLRPVQAPPVVATATSTCPARSIRTLPVAMEHHPKCGQSRSKHTPG